MHALRGTSPQDEAEPLVDIREAALPPASDQTRSEEVHRMLYTSHALSAWNSRLFEFGAFLFLSSLYPSTLLPASIYALSRAAAGAVVSPWLGSYIDTHDRLHVVLLSIAGQRLSIFLSCASLLIMFMLPQAQNSIFGFPICMVVLSILACIEKAGIIMNTIAVERDWVVVVAAGDENRLNLLNARMRRIDLFCKLVAPLAVSLVDAYSVIAAIVATGSLSALSWFVEYFAIARVYQRIPRLRDQNPGAMDAPSRWICWTTFSSACTSYATSAAVLPSLSLSFLYLTALSFNGQLITYVLAPPILLPAVTLSLIRGIAACAELSATYVGPLLISRIGALRAGSWFLNAQMLFVAAAAVSLWLPSTLPQIFTLTLFIIAVIASRIGLWGFDLAAQQQIQDAVPEDFRGGFSSIETAVQNVFEMLSFASTIVWSRPEEFRFPGTMSAMAVLAAAILYALFVRQRRGHLLHFDQGLCGSRYWRSHFAKVGTGPEWSRLENDEVNHHAVGL